MARSLPKKPDMSSHRDRFIATARELGCDEDEEAYKRALGKVARHKPSPEPEKHAPRRDQTPE